MEQLRQVTDDMFMYTTCIRINMAKLYWRIKKNDKWTWTPAEVRDHNDYWKLVSTIHLHCETMEEE